MLSETMAPATHPRSDRCFMIAVYAVQFFFGGWFLFHGSNYFFNFFRFPSGSSVLAHEFIGAMIHSGLFAVIKGVEIAVGVALLANRFVPLAVVAAFPVSFSIAYINLFAIGDPFAIMVSILVIAFNGLIALGHLDRFLPMLVFNNGDPQTVGLRKLFAGRTEISRT
jgi:hypothetical protein